MADDGKQTTWRALGLAWELGYTIAVPLVVLALGGRLLDRRFGTSPWLFICGVLLAVGTSTVSVYRKTARIINRGGLDSQPKGEPPVGKSHSV